jgi:hypothetical protein
MCCEMEANVGVFLTSFTSNKRFLIFYIVFYIDEYNLDLNNILHYEFSKLRRRTSKMITILKRDFL